LSAAKALGRGCIPLCRFGVFAGLFLKLREFERHHGVARSLVQLRKLHWRIGGAFRFAYARLNLSPISHGRAL
jgi:hypothetical protein